MPAKSDNEGSSLQSEGEESVFSDLLDRITESESEREPRGSPAESENQTWTERIEDVEEPEEKIRQLFAERFEQLESVPTPELDGGTLSGTTKRLVFGLMILVIVIGGVTFVAPQMMTTEPDVDAIDAGIPGEASADGSPETLALPEDEARYLNRLFRESTHEIAYCGRLTTDETRPVLTVWKADTVQSDANQIEFRTENCIDGSPEVLLHTHPNGKLALSDRDIRTLSNHSADVMCVQGGELQIQSERQLTNLACYHQQHSDSDKFALSRTTVILTDTNEEKAE